MNTDVSPLFSLKDAHRALNVYREKQERSFIWLETHLKNIRNILVGIYLIKCSLGKTSSRSSSRLGITNTGSPGKAPCFDVENILFSLMQPHITSMLQSSKPSFFAAVTYLSNLLCSNSGSLKDEPHLTENMLTQSFKDTVVTALRHSLRDPLYKTYWGEVKSLLYTLQSL